MQSWILQSVEENVTIPDSLILDKNVPIPEPKEGEVRVKIYAAGLNPADYKVKTPRITGLDGSGVVDKIGPNVKQFNVGDKVYFHASFSKYYGAFSQYTVIDEQVLASLPKGVSFIEAAAIPCAAWTAYQGLVRKMNVQSGRTIAITSGAGGVGGFAVQIAKHLGLTVIATCSPNNNDFVKSLGADYVIDYNTEDVVARIMEITNQRGVDYAIDSVSPSSAQQLVKTLKFFGQLVCVAGSVDNNEANAFFRALSIHHVLLGAAHSAHHEAREDLARIGKEVGDLLESKKLNPMVKEVIDFTQVPSGLKRLEERHVQGKIVLKVHEE